MLALTTTLTTTLAACGGRRSEAQSVPVASAPGPAVVVVAPPAASSAPPPPPGHVDPELTQPDAADVLAQSADGRILVAVRALRDRTPPEKRGHVLEVVGSSYYAVLDPKAACIEETHVLDVLEAVPMHDTERALASLGTDEATRQIADAWSLARRFGLRALGPVAFGPDEKTVFVEHGGTLFYRTGGGAFRAHPKAGG